MGLLIARPLKYLNFKTPRWRMAAILKMIKSSYLCNSLTDFDEIWHGDAYVPLTADRPLKCRIFACKKTERWGAGMVICLDCSADLHMAQLMPLTFTVSCFNKIQIGFIFWYRLTRVVPDKGPLHGCVCVCGYISFSLFFIVSLVKNLYSKRISVDTILNTYCPHHRLYSDKSHAPGKIP